MTKRILIAFTLALGLYAVFANSAAEVKTTSSFNEVWSVVTTNPKVVTSTKMQSDIDSYGTEEAPQLPHHSGVYEALTSIVMGTLQGAAVRTVQSHEDYHDYFSKLVHANGTCFQGIWEINTPTSYTGLFAVGRGLMIGRISAATPQTTKEKDRSFGFAGKLFATMNPDESVTTANFFSVDNLNGTPAQHVLDVAFTNEPPVDVSGFFNPLRIVNDIFAKADINPTFRPLYPVAHAGLPVGLAPVTPHWIRIRVAPGQQNARVQDSDFRAELSPQNYPNGLIFEIAVSDTTKDVHATEGWQTIGQIRTSTMVTSFGCDRRLHFHHATFADPESGI